MTVCEGSRSQAAGLVLLAVGSPTEVPDRVDAAARRLQALSGWPLRALAGGQPPARQLAGLGEGRDTSRPPAWIAPLPVDPGLTLSEGDCWAEALGAWRQPAALLLEAPQLGTGWPAAATALLRQARVPLAGLIQIGGDWEPERRRCEGLPWLGWLADGSAPPSGAPAGDTASATRGERAGEEPELLVALIRRWSGLDLL